MPLFGAGQLPARSVVDIQVVGVSPLAVGGTRVRGQDPKAPVRPNRGIFKEVAVHARYAVSICADGFPCPALVLDHLNIAPVLISADDTARVSVDVTNTGSMAGDEIVQLYIHAKVSLPTRPVKELKDFARIFLNPGETKTVKFALTREKLEAYDLDIRRVVQPGVFEVLVGKNSVEYLQCVLTVKR